MDRLQQALAVAPRVLNALPLQTPADSEMVARARDTIVSQLRAILAEPPMNAPPEPEE